MLLFLNIGVDGLNNPLYTDYTVFFWIHYHMMALEYMRATPDNQHGKQMATENGHRWS